MANEVCIASGLKVQQMPYQLSCDRCPFTALQISFSVYWDTNVNSEGTKQNSLLQELDPLFVFAVFRCNLWRFKLYSCDFEQILEHGLNPYNRAWDW